MKQLLLIGLAMVSWAGAVFAADGVAADAPPEMRAQVTARQFTTLSSETAARIDRITTRPGEAFKKGDTLVVFDCVAQRAQAAKARAVLLAAERTFAVNQKLRSLRSVGDLEVQVSEAEVEKAKADVAVTDAAVGKCTITAAFSGVTVDQKAREYQYTAPGQPLLEILDTHDLEVEFIAPSNWLRWLKPGYRFDLRIEETDKTYPARVARLGPRVDPVSQSIKVYAEIVGDTKDLVAGMSGRARIEPPQ